MKGSDLAFILEFGVFFGAALLFAFWQLRSLKKLDRADAEKQKVADEQEMANSEQQEKP